MMKKLLPACALVIAILQGCTTAAAQPAASHQALQQDLNRLAVAFDGRVGIGVEDDAGAVSVNGDQRFSLQSVMKLVVAMAVMDAVEHQGWHLDDPVLVRRQDLSLYVQPLAKLVTPSGYPTTIGDLVRRAVVDSDSAATDILVSRLGGPAHVQAFLDRKKVRGMRFDRDEKHLQTEILGLQWRPEFLDADALQRATDALPAQQRDAAYRRYQADPRDTATPAGMAALLQALAGGKLLSKPSTAHLLKVMSETVTFPDRLKAGVPAGWTIGHKTGTSGSWNGVTAATNDVGILTTADGRHISIAVFIADTRAPPEARAALMAQVARVVVAHHAN
jgi:beta-lactamase class A